MSGRRSHPRFAVASPWSGAIRVLRDVVVDRTEPHELLAVSHVAAVVGEELSLDLIGGGQNIAIKVTVIESRPVIIDGAVRHRVRLALPSGPIEAAVTENALTENALAEDAVAAPAALGMMTQRVAEAG